VEAAMSSVGAANQSHSSLMGRSLTWLTGDLDLVQGSTLCLQDRSNDNWRGGQICLMEDLGGALSVCS
jgi:hypothetical protein